jgi:5-methylthioadenosine/S-adenosylhomocysteine deaminase
VLACHCVELTENDITLLQRFDVKVAHNAESNMKLASGVAPIPRLINQGICVGMGTDGCASNNDLDLFLEMDSVAKLHKAKTLDPTIMDASTVLKMATIKGAKALGLDQVIGSLETGKKADLIIIDPNKPHLTPMYNPVSHLVYAAMGSDVTTSIINGTVVMEDGQIKTMDIKAVMDDVNRIAGEIAAG